MSQLHLELQSTKTRSDEVTHFLQDVVPYDVLQYIKRELIALERELERSQKLSEAKTADLGAHEALHVMQISQLEELLLVTKGPGTIFDMVQF